MNLSGRKALLTGATGGLGRAIAEALAERGAVLALSARNREALEALAAELPGSGHRSCPPTSPSPAPPSSSPPRPPASRRPRRQRRPSRRRQAGRLQRRAGRARPAGQPRGADAARPRPLPGDARAPAPATSSSSPRSPARPPAPAARSTTRPSSASAASPSASAADLDPRGIGVSIVSPGFIREAGMFADAGAKPPPGMGTSTPEQVGAATVKAIEHNKVEITVAPLLQRARRPPRPSQPFV